MAQGSHLYRRKNMRLLEHEASWKGFLRAIQPGAHGTSERSTKQKLNFYLRFFILRPAIEEGT